MTKYTEDMTERSIEMRLARRIKHRRIDLGMSQATLAEKCGMSNQTICFIEQGKNDFRISTLRRLEEALNCTLVLIPNEDL